MSYKSLIIFSKLIFSIQIQVKKTNKGTKCLVIDYIHNKIRSFSNQVIINASTLYFTASQ